MGQDPVVMPLAAADFHALSVSGQLTGQMSVKPGAESTAMLLYSLPAIAVFIAVVHRRGYPAVATLAAIVGPETDAPVAVHEGMV
jgi:hypothetical protein